MQKKDLIKKEEKELTIQQPVSMEEIILQAIKQGTPVETFEKILAMKRQIKADQAKEEFNQAMSKAQAEFPEIKKTKSVKTKLGVVAYSYAPIETVVGAIKGILSKNGLSYSIKTEMGESKVKSICIIKHIAGHSETSEMEVPLGNKTDIMSNSQVVAAAATFSKRYAFMNALGIMTGDEDKEEALKMTDDNIQTAKTMLDKAMTEKELTKIFLSMSKELKGNKEVIEYAKGIKELILNAKKNETI